MRLIENLKSIVLTILIGISLILTGSLWFDNYYGLSSVVSNMISFFYDKIDLEDTNYIKEYLNPYKTTITNGDNGKWIYYVSSDGNKKCFEYIKNLLVNLTEFTVDSAYNSEWEELINRKSIICEIADKVDAKLLNLVLNNKLDLPTTSQLHISSIAITKSTTGGRIYIKSDDIIYRITVNDIGEFEQIVANYSNSETYSKYVQLAEMGTTTFNGRQIKTKYDVLLPISTKNENRKPISKLIITDKFEDTEKIEEVVEKIFNSDNYIKFITNDNGYIYINDDETVIKIANNVIEYTSESAKNLENEETWVSSFNSALRFVDMASELKNLYLVSAKNIDGAYEFILGTYIEEIPVVDSSNSDFDNRNAKIYIKVENNTVVTYKEKLYSYSSDPLASYLSNFAHNILDTLLVEIPKKSTLTINNVELVYDVSSGNHLPLWLTEYEYNGKIMTTFTEAAKERNY